MAIHCPHCGATLLRDNARFCSHCGSLVRSRSQSSTDPKIPSTPVITQTLSPESAEKDGSTEKMQEPSLQNDVDDSPTQPFAAISSPPAHCIKDPLSSREKRVIPVSSKEPDNIDVSENVPAQFTQSSHDKPEQQDVETFPALPLPARQEYRRPWDIASVGEMLRSVPILLPDGFIGKLRSKPHFWLATLMALIIVGVGCWLLISQLTPDNDPWQRFTDTNLGFSTLYPTDWQLQVDRKRSIVHFYDSTRTAKVDIVVSNVTTSDMAHFLQQRASQVGMSNVTASPLRSFAGSSWQQIQGTLSQEGVSSSVAILATVHNNRLYLLTQIAPQSTYNDEETLIFSSMRASLQFL